MVVCGKRGDSVYSGRSSAGPSHTFTRGLSRGVPGQKAPAAAEPLRAACPLPSPPASLSAAASAAATAGLPAPRSDPRGPAAALRLAPHRPGSSSRGTIDSAPGLGFICNVPHISHAHKAGGEGGGAGKRPLPVVQGLGVEAMFASLARLLEGLPGSPPPARQNRCGAREGKEAQRGSSSRYASFTDWNKVNLLPFFLLRCK